MCYFIKVILKPKSLENEFEEILRKYGKEVSKAKDGNDFLQTDEMLLFATGNEGCDCNTIIGSLNADEHGRNSLRDLIKLRNKGWSETKIKRYVKDANKIVKREIRIRALRNKSITLSKDDPENWVSILKEIKNINRGVEVGIIKNWFANKLNDAILNPKERANINLDQNLGEALIGIKEEKCYMIITKN